MKKFAIIGDSHSIYFKQLNKVTHLVNTHWGVVDYKVADISAATIRGFGNRESTLKVSDQVDKIINEVNPDYLVFGLGQVDTELGYYYRTIVKGDSKITPEIFIEETLETYRQYLISLKAKHGIGIIIKGVNPTVLINEIFAANYISNITTEHFKDKDERLAIKQKVKDELPDYAFRFELNCKLNEALKQLVAELNGRYFDIWEQVIDLETGMVNLNYLPGNFDHHLADSVVVRKIHYDALYEVMKDLI